MKRLCLKIVFEIPSQGVRVAPSPVRQQIKLEIGVLLRAVRNGIIWVVFFTVYMSS